MNCFKNTALLEYGNFPLKPKAELFMRRARRWDESHAFIFVKESCSSTQHEVRIMVCFLHNYRKGTKLQTERRYTNNSQTQSFISAAVFSNNPAEHQRSDTRFVLFNAPEAAESPLTPHVGGKRWSSFIKA